MFGSFFVAAFATADLRDAGRLASRWHWPETGTIGARAVRRIAARRCRCDDRCVTTSPWQGDACSLVDAFRIGERSPVEETEATLHAIAASDLNAFAFVDRERAMDAARRADVMAPFGGVPVAVKEPEV